ncbi:MAG: tRNA pseudouridine(38-40) synthase TruA [Halodesulfurarchaeum sp.]
MRAYRVAYDGRASRGFQRQPDVPTVEDTLFAALSELGLGDADGPPGYTAAGRTDAGVSALAQTVAFEAPDWLSPRAFTAHLPDDVHVWASASVPGDFHATHDARAREYTYFLQVPPADPELIADLEARLAGEHDLHNLTPDETGTVRELSIASSRDGPFRVVRVRADGFPRQLVRRLVALYGRVVRGERPLSFVDRVLGPAPLSGPEGFPPAPPTPLVLTDVSYPRTFEVDPDAVRMATGSVAERRRRDRARARVGRAIQAGMDSAGDNP